MKSPSGPERKSRYGRVQKELSSQTKTPRANKIQTLTGFFRLSPNSRAFYRKPKIFTESIAECLVKKNRYLLENKSVSNDRILENLEFKDNLEENELNCSSQAVDTNINITDNNIQLSDQNDSENSISNELSLTSVNIIDKCDITHSDNDHDMIVSSEIKEKDQNEVSGMLTAEIEEPILSTEIEEQILSTEIKEQDQREVSGMLTAKIEQTLSTEFKEQVHREVSENRVESPKKDVDFFYELSLDGSDVVPKVENSPPKILNAPEEIEEIDLPQVEDENLDDSLESPDFEIHDPSVVEATEMENNNVQEMDISDFEPKVDILNTIEEIAENKSSICNFENQEDVPTIKSGEVDKSIKSPGSKDSANGSSIDAEIMSVQSGELYWAQIGTYPYWPCMISPDPEKKTVSYKENVATKSHIIYHVRFFADNGRRSWVREDKLLLYNGRESFVEKFSKPKAKVGKDGKKRRSSSNSSFMDKLYRKTLKNKTWDLAIAEADSLIPYSLKERLTKFDEILAISR